MIETLYKMNTSNPNDLIVFIGNKHPEYAGLCFYDSENKCLESKDPEKAQFYFDPIHSVLQINALK